MRIAVVGPTHPYKGGVAAHTTALAAHLAAAGHDVVLVSWSRLYPQRLYPGEQAVPDGVPDVEPYPRTVRPLRWDRPGTWWRTGRRLRGYDAVILVAVVPAQVPALRVIAAAARRGAARGAAGAHAPRVLVVAHNVVPHETHPGGAWLTTRLLARADAVLVHSAAMAQDAREHGARRIAVVDLPPHLPGGVPTPRRGPRAAGPLRALALGIVRGYKGVDVLLEAAARVDDVRVTVAGEQWGSAGERVAALARGPRLTGRVDVRAGYVPADELVALLAGHDVLCLTYRHATASQNVLLARAYGLPVLATRVGTFPDRVRDGVDGLLVPPDDVDAVADALRRLTDPVTLARLTANVPAVDLDKPWDVYVTAIEELADPHG